MKFLRDLAIFYLVWFVVRFTFGVEFKTMSEAIYGGALAGMLYAFIRAVVLSEE